MSHTRTGKVTNITGQMLNGANASADTAPAANAMAARCQPQASMMVWASRVSGAAHDDFGPPCRSRTSAGEVDRWMLMGPSGRIPVADPGLARRGHSLARRGHGFTWRHNSFARRRNGLARH